MWKLHIYLLVEEETFSKRHVGTNLHFTSVGANKAAVRPGSGVPSRRVGLPVTEISSAWAGRHVTGAWPARQVRTEAEAGPPAPTPHHPVPAAFPPPSCADQSTHARTSQSIDPEPEGPNAKATCVECRPTRNVNNSFGDRFYSAW